MRTQKTKCQTQQSDMRADFGASLVCTGPYLLMWGTGMDLGKSHQPVYCTCVECWVGLGWVCVCVCGVSRAGRWIRVHQSRGVLLAGSQEFGILLPHLHSVLLLPPSAVRHPRDDESNLLRF